MHSSNKNRQKNYNQSREIYKNAEVHFKEIEPDLKEERVMILENWLEMEQSIKNNATQISNVRNKMPKRVKKRREVDDGFEKFCSWEEYYDYIFPDDQAENKNIKILQMAH